MARDIEEFLRKAAERRKQQAQQQGGAAPPPAAPPPPAPPPPPPPQRMAPPPRVQPPPPAPRPVEVRDSSNRLASQTRPLSEPVDPEVLRRGETVAEHVQRQINTSQISDHARKLGADVGQTDERLEQRLHEKFDHSVGTLGSRKSVTTEELLPSSGQDLLELLTNPRSIRQAILLSEILKRPEF